MLARIFLTLVFAFALGAPSAHATTLTLDSFGNAFGATGVVAGTHIYDIVLVETTCVAEFSGCDHDDDFAPITFGTVTEAADAVTAFLDAVLASGRDAADVFGCIGTTTRCRVNAPSYVHSAGGVYGGLGQIDFGFYSASAGRFFQQITPTANSAFDDTLVYARLSVVGTVPVPEPNTALLVTVGLLALSRKARVDRNFKLRFREQAADRKFRPRFQHYV